MKRNASLDIIRGFAVVLVACLHSIGNGSLTANHISGVSGYLLTGLWLLSASCVPLFLMLSGYLYSLSAPRRYIADGRRALYASEPVRKGLCELTRELLHL